jgi:hypothetical protein
VAAAAWAATTTRPETSSAWSCWPTTSRGGVGRALNLNGFDGKLTRKQVVALARKQDERMRAVAS